MLDDSQMLRNVRDELRWDRAVDHTAVRAIVQDGVVMLSGLVNNIGAKLAAEKAARRAFGVRDVFDGVVVSDDPDSTDEAIVNRVRAMLALDANVPADAIEVEVENGHATLTGTVDRDCQREAARAAAGRVRGVTGVTNLVHVDAVPSTSELRGRILMALQHAAEISAQAVRIELDGGSVTLTGQLPSAREREIVEAAAHATPGVVRIDNRIEII